MAPLANSITPATCVGVSTLMTLPFCGSLVMVRSGNVMRVQAVTRLIGPMRLISAVR